jgi:hypothetical protein
MGATENNLPEKYRPLSAWAYFGYSLLYSIPLIGFVFMILFALDSSNINRRNFTRSFFIVYLLYGILLAVMIMTGAIVAIADSLTN